MWPRSWFWRAIAPYCAASLAFGSFRWQSLAGIALLSGLVSFWYVVLPQKPAADLLLLALMAAVVLTKVFASLYIRPDPRLPLEVLGQAMWIRTGAFALLSVRRVQGVGFGFWPSAREWKIGALFFAADAAGGGRAGLVDRIRQVPPARRPPGSGSR